MDWVSAKELLKAITDHLDGDEFAARLAICRRAHHGLLVGRSDNWWKGNEKQPPGDIDRGFWWAEGYEALEQNWPLGDFSTWIDQRVEWRAFGVSFSRTGAVEMGAGFATPARDSISSYAQGKVAAGKPRWDYIETVAWVLERSLDAVDGVAGLRRDLASAPAHDREAAIKFAMMGQNLDVGPLSEAEADIARRASAGDIEVKASLNGSDLRGIDPDDWDGKSVFLHQGEWWLAPRGLFDPLNANKRQWHGLRFDPQHVVALWPGDCPLEAGSADQPGILLLNRDEWKSAVERFASSLDAAGIASRRVDSDLVAERWNHADGDRPPATMVRGYMKGQPKGRRPARGIGK